MSIMVIESLGLINGQLCIKVTNDKYCNYAPCILKVEHTSSMVSKPIYICRIITGSLP